MPATKPAKAIETAPCLRPEAHGFQASPPGMPGLCDTPEHWLDERK
jgi:hypothetical protein